jgi:hypothetical protein
MRLVGLEHLHQFAFNMHQTLRQRPRVFAVDNTVRNMGKPRACALDYAPAEVPGARVQTEYAPAGALRDDVCGKHVLFRGERFKLFVTDFEIGIHILDVVVVIESVCKTQGHFRIAPGQWLLVLRQKR